MTKETVKKPVKAVTATSRTAKMPEGKPKPKEKTKEKEKATRVARSAKASRQVAAKPAAAKKQATTKAPASTKAPAPPKAPGTAQRKPSGSRRGPAAPVGPYAKDEKFLAEQRQLLEAERAVYLAQASDLKAEADSLAQEREPGDVQFDEESGEGGTVTVDRERDLALSAQALVAVEEIDAGLAKIANGTYGACERCQQPIPKPRLKALPYARLCVACKSGGLSRR